MLAHPSPRTFTLRSLGRSVVPLCRLWPLERKHFRVSAPPRTGGTWQTGQNAQPMRIAECLLIREGSAEVSDPADSSDYRVSQKSNGGAADMRFDDGSAPEGCAQFAAD